MLRNLMGLILVISIFLSFSCNNKVDVPKHLQDLKQKGTAINNDFKKIRLEVENLSHQIEDLYKHQQEIIPTVDTKKYQLAANGVFYKPIDDGGSAVFVSGYYPVNEAIKHVVYFTEPLDTNFKSLVKKYPEIVQVYYNDKHSLNRIYPFFDVLSQYEAKLNIPSFNFYYLADLKHNPEKKSLWVNEPYVDPAGRGWMVSAIAPVYVRDSLVGVPGIDVTINNITQRYIKDSTESMYVIIDHTGVIVAAEEETINLLSFPPLYDHKYIETIKQDTYRKDQYNISLSKDVNVRTMATEILVNKKEQTEVMLNNEKFTTIATHIPELNWYILEIIK